MLAPRKIITEVVDNESGSSSNQESSEYLSTRGEELSIRTSAQPSTQKMMIADKEYELLDLILPEGQAAMNDLSAKTSQYNDEKDSMLTESDKESSTDVLASAKSPAQ